jgi:hypothetical protein
MRVGRSGVFNASRSLVYGFAGAVGYLVAGMGIELRSVPITLERIGFWADAWTDGWSEAQDIRGMATSTCRRRSPASPESRSEC